MAGNTHGSLFRVTTWGESHGAALGAVIDGCPAGIELDEADIQQALDRRKPSGGPASTLRNEIDRVEVLSGVFEGRTTGTPLSLLIRNVDARSSGYEHLKDIFRPGHGDYTYFQKYGLLDWRGGGRASGRETAARVAAGAVAEKVIATGGMQVLAYTKAIGGIQMKTGTPMAFDDLKNKVRGNALYCPDEAASQEMEERLASVRKEGDTLGGIVEMVVRGCPAGLGEPVFDKMDADITGALMSIGTVKAVEVGDGFAAADKKGSQMNDPLDAAGFTKNSAGGVLAGITTGQDIILRVYCKPIPSIALPQRTIDRAGHERIIEIAGRHDICVIPRIIPVCEAMVCLVLADHWLRQKAVRP
ncbi:MAG TPA: chorismate synthase [Smithellaceae bacterium]|nr:chorismate synthase [Smithellaceae bacterium]